MHSVSMASTLSTLYEFSHVSPYHGRLFGIISRFRTLKLHGCIHCKSGVKIDDQYTPTLTWHVWDRSGKHASMGIRRETREYVVTALQYYLHGRSSKGGVWSLHWKSLLSTRWVGSFAKRLERSQEVVTLWVRYLIRSTSDQRAAR